MYILVLSLWDGNGDLYQGAWIARTRAEARKYREFRSADVHHWRLYDCGTGGGWCDGSHDAYAVIRELPDCVSPVMRFV